MGAGEREHVACAQLFAAGRLDERAIAPDRDHARTGARAQIELWEQSVSLWAQTLRHLLGGEPPPISAPDKRFKHPEWAENAIFSYIRDSYLLSARAILSAVRGVNVDSVMRTLVARGMVTELGTEPSGAVLYGTTPYFLERLGLGSLDALPPLAPYLPDIDTLGIDEEEQR